jgi:predicted transcriptional regulator
MTPAQYREKWGLPRDYPMAAPAYSERRSEMAKQLGLGQKMREARAAKKAAPKKGRRAKRAAA